MTEITSSLLTRRPVSRRTRRVLARAIAPLALMGLIFYLSAQPFTGPELPWWEIALRKLGHLVGYAALAALWAWALAPRLRRPLPVAVAIAVAYAIADEYHQSFVEGRHGTGLDVAIDAVGALIAAALIAWWRRRVRSDPALIGCDQDRLRAVERA